MFNMENDFLYGDLDEEVYIEQPLGYVSQEEYVVQAQEDNI